MKRRNSSLSNGFSAERTTLVILDPTQLGCESFETLLSLPKYGIKVAGIATDDAAALAAVKEHKPDVFLISSSPQFKNGMQSGILQELSLEHPGVRIILLLDKSDRNQVVAAFRNGVKGIFFRTDPLANLWKCIRQVHEGQIWAGTRELQFLLEALVLVPRLRLFNVIGEVLLTPREEQVACLVAEGRTNQAIAEIMGVSEHTVKNLVFRIYNKLGISTRVELVLYAISQGKVPVALMQNAEREVVVA